MRKATKIWIATATAFVALGLIMFTVVMAKCNWDFSKLVTSKYETNTYEITDEFDSISMNTDTADIRFAPSDNEECKVVCYEEEKVKHSVAVKEDTLVINAVNSKAWYEYIGINFSSPKITVYLPKAKYNSLIIREDTGDVEIPDAFTFGDIDIALSTGAVDCFAFAAEKISIKTSTGNVCVENVSAKALDISVSTGKVTVFGVTCEGEVSVGVSTGKASLADVKCKNLKSSGDTGDVFLKNVIASERFSVSRTTGDVKLDGCDASELFIETDTGDVYGTLLSEKVFITKTDTGSINVPKSVTGGRCEIATDTGNIRITVEN